MPVLGNGVLGAMFCTDGSTSSTQVVWPSETFLFNITRLHDHKTLRPTVNFY